ncbi:hypothetical protein T459_00357 [Capsicum annuum]|uniref:Replication protein A 70 kDa DNA-binding subunit B/D first OB fold domain-containing protein n=1 Tax=Capsicum annuum TaxID=4072 RepID=A0A2G3AE20_CAPAN|nr:hypothetical protein T459_00357 [Capsicum annuum]
MRDIRAVTSARAAEIYGLNILAKRIQSDRIQASVGTFVFTKLTEEIQEQGLYFMKNFIVIPNKAKIKINNHTMKLLFTYRTSIQKTDDLQFIKTIFKCWPFEDLINQVDVDENKLFGKYFVRNSWTASKLWINPQLHEVAEFISRMEDVCGDKFERISQLSSQNNSSISDELSSGSLEVKIIKQSIECMEDFVVENDMISTSNTPVKRSISKSESFVVEIDDDPNAQLSSSKVKRVGKMRKSHESQHLSFTMD